MKTVITMRTLDHLGGVVSYYKSGLPYIRNDESLDVVCFYLGASRDSSAIFHPITDQIRFKKFVDNEKPNLVHVNPSLDFKSFSSTVIRNRNKFKGALKELDETENVIL